MHMQAVLKVYSGILKEKNEAGGKTYNHQDILGIFMKLSKTRLKLFLKDLKLGTFFNVVKVIDPCNIFSLIFHVFNSFRVSFLKRYVFYMNSKKGSYWKRYLYHRSE